MKDKENENLETNQNGTDTNNGPENNAGLTLKGPDENTNQVTPPPVPKEKVPEDCTFIPGEKGQQDAIQWELCDGRTALYRKLVGFNIRMAQRAAGDDETMGNFALISQGLMIDGKPVTVEELDMMSEDLISDIMSKRQVFTSGRKK